MADIKEKIREGWLHVNFIIEVLGKPADYIEKVLNAAVDKLGKEKNIELINKKVHEAKSVEKEKTSVFTTFADIELLVPSLFRIVDIIFDYMPSSVEIVEPSNINLKLEDANALLNDLATRLHQYDALLKKVRLERNILIKELEELKKENK